MTEEQENIIQLIATQNEQNIELALQLIKSENTHEIFFSKRYMPIIEYFKRKTIRAIKSIPSKILYIHKRNTKKFREILKIAPVEMFCLITNLKIINTPPQAEIIKNLYFLTQIKELYLPYNKLAEVPKSILSLTRLKILQLSNNYIVDIPSGISALNSLELLQLQNNNIKEIPNEIEKLQLLKTLNLANNAML